MEDIILPNTSTRRTPASHDTACPPVEAQHRPTKTWWFTGLSGAGKSTLAHALLHSLLERGETACILDGDELRRHLSQDLGFSDADRLENVRRTAAVARLLNDQSMHAIVALISPTRECREIARRIVTAPRFIEVHVSTPLDVCAKRDPKGLYARAMYDDTLLLTGLRTPYEEPERPEMRIDTTHTPVSKAVKRLLQYYQETDKSSFP